MHKKRKPKLRIPRLAISDMGALCCTIGQSKAKIIMSIIQHNRKSMAKKLLGRRQ